VPRPTRQSQILQEHIVKSFGTTANRILFEQTTLKSGNSALEQQDRVNVPMNVGIVNGPAGRGPALDSTAEADSFKNEQLSPGLGAHGQQELGRTGEPDAVTGVNAQPFRLREVFLDSN
jgi:hypothetical protein